ncbi:uncharacterized protein RJT21DRAFT_54401 [Scheffersomyces amazonensis]|uniref:uncharacterized protein n=1 Tax=Scheffersomyces amazonensis TaxID=1078765 RepID=UPI00315C808C
MPSASTLRALNAQYLDHLGKNPLLTKSITAGIYAALNEIISSIISDDLQETAICGKYKVKHFFTPKLLSMIFYGSLISTPISHNIYEVINKKIFVGKLTTAQQVAKFFTSLLTVTPLLAGVYGSWLSIINNYKFPESWKSTSIPKELAKIFYIVKLGLKKVYPVLLKSSLITSFFSLIIAQKYIPPELWVVFLNTVFFILGTYQNTKLKKQQKLQRKQQQQQQQEKKEDVEEEIKEQDTPQEDKEKTD